MSDAELADFLGLNRIRAVDRNRIIASLTQDQRSMYEHMKQVETEIVLWQNGVGPKPEGVIVCKPRGHRHEDAG